MSEVVRSHGFSPHLYQVTEEAKKWRHLTKEQQETETMRRIGIVSISIIFIIGATILLCVCTQSVAFMSLLPFLIVPVFFCNAIDDAHSLHGEAKERKEEAERAAVVFHLTEGSLETIDQNYNGKNGGLTPLVQEGYLTVAQGNQLMHLLTTFRKNHHIKKALEQQADIQQAMGEGIFPKKFTTARREMEKAEKEWATMQKEIQAQYTQPVCEVSQEEQLLPSTQTPKLWVKVSDWFKRWTDRGAAKPTSSYPSINDPDYPLVSAEEKSKPIVKAKTFRDLDPGEEERELRTKITLLILLVLTLVTVAILTYYCATSSRVIDSGFIRHYDWVTRTVIYKPNITIASNGIFAIVPAVTGAVIATTLFAALRRYDQEVKRNGKSSQNLKDFAVRMNLQYWLVDTKRTLKEVVEEYYKRNGGLTGWEKSKVLKNDQLHSLQRLMREYHENQVATRVWESQEEGFVKAIRADPARWPTYQALLSKQEHLEQEWKMLQKNITLCFGEQLGR